MVGYTAIENAVIRKLIEHFPDELSESRTKAGDIDAVFTGIFDEGASYGVFLEFSGGRDDTRSPFDKSHWVWVISGVFVIRFGEDIEQRMRAVADRLATLFEHDHTVGSVTPRARIVEIGDAEPGQVNDVPFYWLPFLIEALDR